MNGFIRIRNEKGEACTKTANHAATLAKLGYAVQDFGNAHIQIECTGFVATADLSTPEKAKATLGEVVKAKQLFTYETRFTLPSGKVLHGVLACGQLGQVSALVAKPYGIAKKATTNAKLFGAILDSIL